MAGTTKAELLDEVKHLRRRVIGLERQRRDGPHVTETIIDNDAAKGQSQEFSWLKQVYKDAPVGLCCFDTQLKYVNINQWLADLNGLSVEEHLGHSVSELFPERSEKMETRLRQVIETGESVLESSICIETPAQQDVPRYFQYNFAAVKSNADKVEGVSCAVIETTAQKQAELLGANQQFLKNITDSETQLVWVYNLKELRNVYANPSLAKFFGRPLREVSSMSGSFIREQIHPDDLELYEHHGQSIREASDEDVLEREVRIRNHSGEFRWLSARDVVLDRSLDGSPLQILGTAVDITEHKRAESLLTGEKKVLEVVSSSSSQDGGLTELVEFIETQSDGMICSILLLDEDGIHLHHGASINLPDDYNQAIDGAEIGPNEGSCGTAAFLNQTVIVSDIANDPLWVNYRELAMKHGLRACWSIPIQSSTGSVLGTFAMYYSKPRSPDAFHERLIERAVHLASIAIERKNAEDKLTLSEQKLRRAQQITHVGSFELKPDGSPLNWSEECYRILGLEPNGQVPSQDQFLNEIVHPDDRSFLNRTIQKFLNTHKPFNYEYRILRPDGSIRWVHSRGEPILDDTDQIVSIHGTLLDITDRKLTIDRLDEFNVALSNAMPGISRLDITGHYVEVNDDYASELGYEPQELIGSPWNPTVHPEDIADVVQAYEEMCRDGKAEFEARAVRKDGSLFHKQVLMVRIDAVDGSMTGHHCFMRNITERKNAESAIRESNDKFHTIFESVPECVKLLDANGNLLDMNAAGLKMIEADSIEQVRGESVYNLIAPEHLDAFITNGQNVFRGESNTQEFEIIGLRGTRRWMETHQVPLRNTNGETTTLLAVTHDITERKRAEELQKASERWFRSIFEQAGVAVGVVESKSGRIVRVNTKYEKLIGYSSEELVNKTWMEITHPDDIPQDRDQMDKLLSGQIRDFSIEKRLISKEGSVIWINLTVSPMWQPEETPEQHIVILQNITARKQAEAEIQSRAQQQAAVAELGQRALSGANPSELFEETVSVITTVLNADYAKVLELLPDGESLAFRAMVGWNEKTLKGRVLSIKSRSQAAATLRSKEPIVVEDMVSDGRFDITLSLCDHAIVSGITVVISGQTRPFGILGVHSCDKREFTKNDISFLQAVANILGEAIDRKHAEEALKESEHRLRLVTDAMPAFISYLGSDRCYEFVNRRYESTFGLDRTQIIGKSVWDILGTDYYELIKPRIDSVLAGNPVKYESVVQIEHIGKRSLSTEHVPDMGPDGVVRGFYTLAVDITERKKIEDELNTIFDMSPDAICVADIDTATFVKVNPSFRQVLGYSEEELLGRTFLDFIHPDDVKPTIAVIEQELKQGKMVMRFQNRYRTKAGSYRWLDWSANPNVASGLSYNIAHDITERKAAEEQAWKYRDELAHMSRISTMGEMATGIAHELNQPLTAIASYSFAANIMAQQVNSNPHEIRDILSKLENQAIRAGEIVRRLRNFAKKTESVRVPTDLNMLVRDVIKFVEPDIRQAAITLTLNFDEPSPTVLVDEIQIQQVLVNLIRNSIDAMQDTPTSKRKVTVSTRDLKDGQAEVTVYDSGIGLTKDELEQVFNAFFSTKQEGMGMGLPISRSIVEAHGGKLLAKPNNGPGVTFGFTIPREDYHG